MCCPPILGPDLDLVLGINFVNPVCNLGFLRDESRQDAADLHFAHSVVRGLASEIIMLKKEDL